MSETDVTAAFYNQHASAYMHNTQHSLPFEWREKFIAQVTPGGHVLDIGCAYARDSAYFAEQGFAVTGVDVSDEMIRLARERVPDGTFLRQDIRELTVTGPFDGAWVDSVLLHIPRAEMSHVLRQITNVLKPSAPLFIGMKAGQTEGIEPDARYGGALKFYAYVTHKELENLLSGAGFMVHADDIVEEVASHAYGKGETLLKAIVHTA